MPEGRQIHARRVGPSRFATVRVGSRQFVSIQDSSCRFKTVRVAAEKLRAIMTITSANIAESPASAIAALEELARLASLQASVSVALVEATSMSEMLARCAEAIVRELNVAFARVWTLSDDQTTLELRASAGADATIDGAQQSRIPVGQFKIGKIAKEHVPVLTNSIAGDPQIHDQEWAKREGLVAFAGHPLLVDDRLVGVLAVFSRSALPAATLSTLGAVANAIALGIERKTSEQSLLLRNAELVGIQNRAGIARARTHRTTGNANLWNANVLKTVCAN